MAQPISRRTFGCGILSVVVSSILLGVVAPAAAASKPVFLYSLYFNAKGENRYSPTGTYRDVLGRLGEQFDVRVNDLPLNSETLKDVSVVLISNPNDKANKTNPPPPHMSAADISELTRFVNAGGGLIVMGNQEGHNLEIKDFNQLLGKFGMKFESNYTDAKLLKIPSDVPIIGGLRWGYYTGDQVVIDPNNDSKARGLVINDLNQKPAHRRSARRSRATCLRWPSRARGT